MADVTFTVPPYPPITLIDIARGYTIGGSAYAPALLNVNGWDGAYSINTPLPEGTQVFIPEDWLGFQVTPDPSKPQDRNSPIKYAQANIFADWRVWAALAAVALVMNVTGRRA